MILLDEFELLKKYLEPLFLFLENFYVLLSQRQFSDIPYSPFDQIPFAVFVIYVVNETLLRASKGRKATVSITAEQSCSAVCNWTLWTSVSKHRVGY
jgi:hypothetical protein